VLKYLGNSIRWLGRPVLHQLRRLLTPAPPLPKLKPVEIESGFLAGCKLLLPVPGALAEKIVHGAYEPECSSVAELLVKQGDICYDIGGHCGYYTALFARLASEGQVYCFEPVPELAERIRETVRENRFSNVTVHSLAIADRQRELLLRFAADQSLDDSMAYLSQFGGVDTERSRNQYGSFSEIQVPCQCLDQIGLPDPHFIKMDAEAAEISILEGGREMIRRCKPRMLIEIHGSDLALRCADLLGPIGYVAVQVMPRCENMSILWIHHEDRDAWSRFHQAFGSSMTILYSEERQS
jgi:FkbM family methyltransferase